MDLTQKIGLSFIAAAILLGIGFCVGKWVTKQLQLADLRTWKHEWHDNVAPRIKDAPTLWLADNHYQPDPWAASEAYAHQWPDRTVTPVVTKAITGPINITDLRVTGPLYDPGVDVRAAMARQDEETREFLRELRER
jgi:hypothetical protein